MSFWNIIFEIVLPLVNIGIALDTLRVDILNMRKFDNKDQNYTLIVLNAVGALLFAVLYILVLTGLDAQIFDQPGDIMSYLVRPTLAYIIVVMNLSARNWHHMLGNHANKKKTGK
jgi:hypothetical protein